MNSQLVHSYSSALYETSKESNKVESIASALLQLKEVFAEPEISDFFDSPLYTAEDKETLLLKSLGELKDQELIDFLKLLSKNQRLSLLPQIAEMFQMESEDSQQKKKGQATSARALTEGEQQEIQKNVSTKLGFEVDLSFDVDPVLSGGVEIRVGSYLIEDSLQSGLRRLNESLKRSAH